MEHAATLSAVLRTRQVPLPARCTTTKIVLRGFNLLLRVHCRICKSDSSLYIMAAQYCKPSPRPRSSSNTLGTCTCN
ncbi:hypothetical protein FA13DRAFT_857692 [Coprinellus micaceus]|uniref:Uncharacterized protein n=1 Tax=Coprinellus micaceus TaxID=71717 RepID=A0A4Y7T0W1_COPMI|nr:hypothetical protein FA13DRAFT_857692 [Coprinellus micaceus]